MTETARWKISEENRRLLELEYDRKRFPSPRTKKRLADALDVDTRRVQAQIPHIHMKTPPPP